MSFLIVALGILGLIISPSRIAYADIPVIRIDSGQEKSYLSPRLQYFVDEGKEYGIDNLLSQIPDAQWRAIGHPAANFGYSKARIWVRFAVQFPREPAGRDRVLQIPYSYLERVDLYSRGDSPGIGHFRSGIAVPLKARARPDGFPAFQIHAPADGSPLSLYLSAESHFPIRLPLLLKSEPAFSRDQARRNLLLGIFFGWLCLAFLFNFFLAVALRSKLYLHYSLYVFFFALLFLSSEGITVQYLWPDSPWWAVREMQVFGAATVLFYAQFVRIFLDTRERTPRLDRALATAVSISSTRFAWVWFPLNQALGMISELAIPAMSFITVAMGVTLFRKVSRARYFLAASVAFNLGIGLMILQATGVFWIGTIIDYAPHLGAALEVALLSLALAGRILQVNAQLRRANEELNAQRATMIQAEKMSALGRMAAGIAHEINNPLAIIHGRASQLKRHASFGAIDRQQLARISENIEDTSARISKIIASLRSFARDSKGDPPVILPISAILREALELCRERFSRQGIRLTVRPPDREITIQCRAVEICQVLVNLLNNAFDAVENRPEKWVQLTAAELGDQVEVSVTDSGAGVPPGIRDRIHEPFFTTKEAGKGTGLGLSISKAIIESHNGSLWLDTQSPHTRFVFRLPKANPCQSPTSREQGFS